MYLEVEMSALSQGLVLIFQLQDSS